MTKFTYPDGRFLLALDTATPQWLMSLRDYINASVSHQLAENARDEDGFTSLDAAGQRQCENLWDEVVALIHEEAVPRDVLYAHVKLVDIKDWCLKQSIPGTVRTFLTHKLTATFLEWRLDGILLDGWAPYPAKRNFADTKMHLRKLIQQVPRAILEEAAAKREIEGD